MADEVVIHKDEVREYLSRLAGVCQILDSVPEFLGGENEHGQSIRLTKAELGGFDEFHTKWNELCADRLREAKRVADFMRSNRGKLIRAVEKQLGVDMDAAASFPPTIDSRGDADTLEDAIEAQGLDVENPNEAAHRAHPNIPE